MKKIIALTIAALMLLPVAALAQTGPSYQKYADQSLINSVDSLKMLGNALSALFAGSRGESNAAFLGQWQANATMAGNSSTVANARYLSTMAGDSQSQDDINYGFLALGQNASQIQCGDLRGPGEVPGNKTLGSGNCKTDAGTKGMSNVSRLRAEGVKSGTVGGVAVTTDGARAIAALIRGGLNAFALVQKGIVGAINPFSN